LKRIIFIILIISAGSFIIPADSVFSKPDTKTNKVIAYYFHGTFRCATCRRLEEYSKEAIKTNFNDAVSSGKLEFKTVNIEEEGNEHFAKDYQLYTKSLILSLVKNGKEVKSKNLSRIWEYAGNKEKFTAYVKEEISAFLGEI
jgi:hypothetical protein